MIVKVSRENEVEWAKLHAALWPECTMESQLDERRKSGLEYEFLYYAGDHAVAFLSLSLRHDYVEGTDSSPVGYLEGIYVLPEYRNRGIARELIEFAKKWSIDNGCSELASDCEITNEVSRSFHKKMGFAEANIVVCFTMGLR